MPRVSGGRYGLSSKEFTPGMVAGVFAELAAEHPRRRFTVGINDDVSGTSISYDPTLDIEPTDTVRAVFFGLGSDGTVGANKNTIKILGAEEGIFAQGYFVYDSKKSGSHKVSHLRFGPKPIRASYLVQNASQFVGCTSSTCSSSSTCSAAQRRAPPCCSTADSGGKPWDWAAAPGAGADPGQGHRRIHSFDARKIALRRRDGGPDQHCPADLLLRDLRVLPAGAGDREDQAVDHQEATASATPRWSRKTMQRLTCR